MSQVHKMNRNTVGTETALDLELSDAVLVHDLHFVLPRRYDQTQRDLIYAALQRSESLLDRGIGVVVPAGRSASFKRVPRSKCPPIEGTQSEVAAVAVRGEWHGRRGTEIVDPVEVRRLLRGVESADEQVH